METTHLTPDSDSNSDDASDLDLDMDPEMRGEEGRESYKMQSRDVEKVAESQQDMDSDDEEEVFREDSGGGGRGRGSISTVQSYQLYTPDEERAVVRKFDRKLVVFVALLYMLSFLDRSSMSSTPL